ncbi:hypothetical protein, partial [Kitasatospora sp. MBT63]|uniref:hypothetical protein n=1 Tax=Kitasatospora sp. MBT63 TaxID=1444768 RepID=UPI0019D6C712
RALRALRSFVFPAYQMFSAPFFRSFVHRISLLPFGAPELYQSYSARFSVPMAIEKVRDVSLE